MELAKKILSVVFRVGISVILIAFLFRQVDAKSLFAIIRKADKPLLIAGFFITLTGYILALFRWEMLLKAVKINLPLKRVTISFAGGVFFNLFLPSTIGGDFMRTIDLAAHTQKTKEVMATVFLDRFSGYIGLVTLALTGIIIGWNHVQERSVMVSFLIIFSTLVFVLLILFNKNIYVKINKLLHSPKAGKIRDLITNMHQEIHAFRGRKGVLIRNLLLSVLIQTMGPLSFFVIALAVGVKLDLVYFFVFIPIIGAITLLPISIGGLGLRDATTIYFFGKVGMARDTAFAMSLLNFIFILVIGALGGFIYVLTVHHRRIQSHQSSVSS